MKLSRTATRSVGLFLWVTVVGSPLLSHARGDDRFAKWEEAIRAFEAQDRESPPRKGGILFIGSSSIRLWDLDAHFPDRKPLNRGFGGSELADSAHFADRIILPYEPRVIVLYAGDNDIAHETTPCEVHADFERFVDRVHTTLPATRIVYIAIKPSLKRWELVHRMRAANALIQATCVENEQLTFVDIDGPMIGTDGTPRAELFQDDGLHLNAEGYELWTKLVRPHLR